MLDPSHPVTLREVARAAGVSTATASRALAREGAVSADVRRRVLAAAGRLGYTPNLAARSLAARRSGLIGIMVNRLAEPLVAEGVPAFARRLAEAGYGVVIATTLGSAGESVAAMLQLVSRGVEGIALAEAAHAPEMAAALRARGLPWVGLADGLDGACLAVDGGRRRGAELACRYLLSLGHHRIGIIAPTAATAAGVADALAGGTAPAPAPEAALVHDLDAVEAAMRDLLDRVDPPTAVIGGTDLHALAAMRACLGKGCAVPRAVSIIGFGDADFARRVVPALTTVRIPGAAVGIRLAEGLLQCLEHGAMPPAFDVAVKLVVRETTAPAP